MQFGVVKIAFLLALPSVAFQVFAAVDLTSVNHVQTGPKANSYVYLLGQNMSFVCNSTVRVIWTIPAVDISSAGAFSSKGNSRITTTDANNEVFPSDITILEAASGDSNTTVTCQDGLSTLIEDVITIFVEGAPECPVPTLTSTTDSSLSISWVPPPTLLAVQYYLLDVTPAVDSVNGTQNISSTSFTVTGLQPSTEYAISVQACTEAGCSSSCIQLFTTGPFWEDSFVSVCSSSGAEPTITVFVQYSDNGVNTTAGGFRVSIEGTSYSTNASVTGSGDYQASIGGLTAGADYTVRVQPFATILGGNVISRSICPPQCGTVGVVIGNDSCPSFTFTPQGSVLPSTVVVSYQLVADPSSAGSLNCDYPIDPRTCRLVVPGGTYTVRATPQNNCGSPSSTCPSHTVPVPAGCELVITSPDPVYILPAVIAPVVLIIFIIIIIVVVLLVTRHCYKKSAKRGSSSRQEELYAQVEGKKVYEDINMTDNPAYGPISHAPPVYI